MARGQEGAYHHGSLARTGILLINLGTPEAPTARALRPYLAEFLSDPRVIEIPRMLWWPILHGVILNTRPRKSAEKYAKIWSQEGSPLRVHTERQAKLLRGYLGERVKAPLLIDYAMRYGRPSIAERLRALREQGCERLLVIPLYPQYAASSTASAFDALASALADVRNLPELRVVKHFHDHPGYILALAQSVNEYWVANGRPEQLVMSFHGLPRFSLERGDPYHCECHKSARLLGEALGLKPDRYRITFQSRFGRARWLEPYTIQTMAELGKQRLRRVDVVCPGFVADCLETLEEIAIENKAAFVQAGGGEFHYIPCLNERDAWIRALSQIALENLHGWIGPELDQAAAAQQAHTSRTRALALGARD